MYIYIWGHGLAKGVGGVGVDVRGLEPPPVGHRHRAVQRLLKLPALPGFQKGLGSDTQP